MDFIDLASQQKKIRKNIDDNIARVLGHGKYVNGPEVKELEDLLADYTGVKYAVGCSSGTDALLMPLMAYDIGPGDAVFTTPFTFIATAEVIQLLRAVPVFVDIEPDTFNIDVSKLEEIIEITKKEGKLNPKGIIPVDIFGQPADYDEINSIAEKNGLFVLEDAAQSFGAKYKGRRSCSLADVAATSFFPAKPLGCYGDGGMVFTDDSAMYEKMLSIREHGKGSDKYNNVRIGINGRLDSLQAAVLIAKFAIFEEEISLRQEVADRYNEALKTKVAVPYVKEHNLSAWAQYSVTHPDRENIQQKLTEEGIPSMIYYPRPLHLQDAFRSLGYKQGAFPVSEEISKKIISLPMHPYLNQDEQDKVIEVINNSVK